MAYSLFYMLSLQFLLPAALVARAQLGRSTALNFASSDAMEFLPMEEVPSTAIRADRFRFEIILATHNRKRVARMFTRRELVQSSILAAGAIGRIGSAYPSMSAVPSRLKQSACRWCYKDIELTDLCAFGSKIGLVGIDLLEPDEYDIPRRYGLHCTMGYVADGPSISDGLNRPENHAAFERAYRTGIPLAAKSGVPNVITFSGNRQGMSDAEGTKNTVAGLNRIKGIAEDYGVTVCLELLNSKIDHPDYMADHTVWGARVMEEVNSPHVKLLFDIYHMQIMEGDLIHTIRDNIQWIGHFHTGGVPGRHELNDDQEVNWVGVAKAIADLKFAEFFAHEFVPITAPLPALEQAVRLCSV